MLCFFELDPSFSFAHDPSVQSSRASLHIENIVCLATSRHVSQRSPQVLDQ